MTPAAVARLVPDVAALPPDTPVNVNTATPNVLAALLPSLDADAIAAIVAARRERPYQSVDDFVGRSLPRAPAIESGGLGVGSRHFLVSVLARQGQAVVRAEALIARIGPVPTVVWQVID